ncbi:unnamed protein product [Larinioides sclopetarius]|uniref:Uncharacterized protein n=1 Tax=Larinioides sclopetarius TaxID=280406 RepID=A0AAV1ZG21_9ARAC
MAWRGYVATRQSKDNICLKSLSVAQKACCSESTEALSYEDIQANTILLDDMLRPKYI